MNIKRILEFVAVQAWFMFFWVATSEAAVRIIDGMGQAETDAGQIGTKAAKIGVLLGGSVMAVGAKSGSAILKTAGFGVATVTAGPSVIEMAQRWFGH